MGTYTTAAKVKSRFEDFDTDLSDAKIEVFIITAESLVDLAMRKTARGSDADFSFDSKKHGILEETTSVLAAFSCLAAQPTGQSGNISSARAALMGDFFWAQARRNLKYLNDERNVKYLAGL
ncbi:hypothetical protein LCGC14_2021930 [marine sediment metagenome]|uniref:Uncharacterized protein n=1 Tax=marine sediment metagenome TaxID=412755 RepID=A0A0F9HAJ5_9ZZZZ